MTFSPCSTFGKKTFPKHEYEFRLLVCGAKKDVYKILKRIASQCNSAIFKEHVYYAKPHFRYRYGVIEKKRLVSAETVFRDGYWFRWVHSIETPFEVWSPSDHERFVKDIGNAQDGFEKQTRLKINVDAKTQVYAFYDESTERYHLVFEYEFGTFRNPLTKTNGSVWLTLLSSYRHVYTHFQTLNTPTYIEKKVSSLSRKKVVCVSEPPTGKNILVAHKWDGTFGFIHSYRDKIKETWEGDFRRIRTGETLGDGIVFAAERLNAKDVVILDVYRVRGENVASWCRRDVLTQFLPSICGSLPHGYKVQEYKWNMDELQKPVFKTDGFIYHDLEKDEAYKLKTQHSLDLLYRDGYFWLTTVGKRFKCSDRNLKQMRNNHVYEVSAIDGRVIRIRNDRFTGNTIHQILNVSNCNPQPWRGEKWENIPTVSETSSKCGRKKMKRN